MTHSHKTLLIYNGPARGKVIVCRDADGLSELATALSSAACVYAGEIEPDADIQHLLAEYDRVRAWNISQLGGA